MGLKALLLPAVLSLLEQTSAQYNFPFTWPNLYLPSVPITAVNPQPTAAPPYTNKIAPKVASVQYNTQMQYLNASGVPWNVYCDLGFSGVIDGSSVWTFGDTLTKLDNGNYQFQAVDSIGVGFTQFPTIVYENYADPTGQYINSLIPLNSAELATGGYNKWAFGGTNVVAPNPGQNLGIIYYLKLARSVSSPSVNISGAGVATISLAQGLPRTPTVTRIGDTLWQGDEPQWGDMGVVLDNTSGYLYIFGHGPANGPNNVAVMAYLARVPKGSYGDVTKYQYWLNDTQSWTNTRLSATGRTGTLQITAKQAIFGYLAVGQAAPFWNNYYQRWMYIYGDYTGFSNVLMMISDGGLTGPWRSYGVVAQTSTGGSSGYKYAVTGHPEFDTSGKSILATWSQNNVIYTVTINFA